MWLHYVENTPCDYYRVEKYPVFSEHQRRDVGSMAGFRKSVGLYFCAVQVGTGIIGGAIGMTVVLMKWCLKDTEEDEQKSSVTTDQR